MFRLTLFVLVLSSSATRALVSQPLLEESFESPAAGDAPNCALPYGPWRFSPSSCECQSDDFMVTEEPEGGGQALRVDVDGGCATPVHLSGFFEDRVEPGCDELIVASFDIFVPDETDEGGMPVVGGAVHVSGDHGGGGISSELDRGPQLAWWGDGTLTFGVHCPIQLVSGYPRDEWQSLRLTIDLATDSYDVDWGLRGEDLTRVAAKAPFLGNLRLSHLDRFTVAYFPDAFPGQRALSYLDNVRVEIVPKERREALLAENFDSLTPGSHPDVETPAGAFHWPRRCVEIAECGAEDFTIVESAETRDDLQLRVDIPRERCVRDVYLTAFFEEAIAFDCDPEPFVVAFDILVPDAIDTFGSPVGGGVVMLTGNVTDSTGFDIPDRGPQVAWQSTGRVTRAPGGVPLWNFPRDTWQSVRLEVDPLRRTYAVEATWNLPGQSEVSERREGLPFHGPDVDRLDRLVIAYFDDLQQSTLALFDNFRVELLQSAAARFRRGDCNDDGAVDISDGVCILNWLFLGGTSPECISVTNTNGDEHNDISDATYLLNHLFIGGPAPAPPFPDCGPGTLPTDEEDCATSPLHCQL